MNLCSIILYIDIHLITLNRAKAMVHSYFYELKNENIKYQIIKL